MERFFFRDSDSDKWHWLSSCPFFPQQNHPEIIKSVNFPEPEKICKHCLGIEMKNVKEGIFLKQYRRY